MVMTWAACYALLGLPALAIVWTLEAGAGTLPDALQRVMALAVLVTLGWLLADLTARLLWRRP